MIPGKAILMRHQKKYSLSKDNTICHKIVQNITMSGETKSNTFKRTTTITMNNGCKGVFYKDNYFNFFAYFSEVMAH